MVYEILSRDFVRGSEDVFTFIQHIPPLGLDLVSVNYSNNIWTIETDKLMPSEHVRSMEWDETIIRVKR